eukprot:3482447-Pleurochrysis_carterae.AAC.1
MCRQIEPETHQSLSCSKCHTRARLQNVKSWRETAAGNQAERTSAEEAKEAIAPGKHASLVGRAPAAAAALGRPPLGADEHRLRYELEGTASAICLRLRPLPQRRG